MLSYLERCGHLFFLAPQEKWVARGGMHFYVRATFEWHQKIQMVHGAYKFFYLLDEYLWERVEMYAVH